MAERDEEMDLRRKTATLKAAGLLMKDEINELVGLPALHISHYHETKEQS